MKFYSYKLVILLLVISLISCKEKPGWDVSVKGKVRYPISGEISIQEMKPDGSGAKEIIKLNSDSTYSHELRILQPGYYRLNFYDKQFIPIILDHSDITVNVDGNYMNGFVEIKGSPDQDLMDKIQNVLNKVQTSPAVQNLEIQFATATSAQDQEKVKALRKQYQEILDKGKRQIASILKDQPPSLALLNVLMQNNLLDPDTHWEVYESTVIKLKEQWSDYDVSKDFIARVERMKITRIGAIAPEIEMPNPEGQVIKLSSLRGKYVLVDFWAKWCGPCRKENPNVVKAYKKYKAKGFEVFGVSLDKTKEDWVQAIEEDGLVWTQVSDLKYFESKAAADYNIESIPFSILIDPEGKIVAKNLRGLALDEKLEEVFK